MCQNVETLLELIYIKSNLNASEALTEMVNNIYDQTVEQFAYPMEYKTKAHLMLNINKCVSYTTKTVAL